LQVSPQLLSVFVSILVITMAYVGGIGSIYGAVGGAILLTLLTELLRSVGEFRLLAYSLILILVSISIPVYNQSILRAKESVLKQDLFQLRSLISQYTLDKQKAPQSLDDLVQGGYLKQIPNDPMTGSNSSWTVEQEDSLMSVDQQDPGISDVHSGSTATSSDGSAYSSW